MLQIGSIFNPPKGIISCIAADEAGSVTIPQNMVEAFPYYVGGGQTQHPSLIRRLDRKLVQTPNGPIDLATMSEAGLLVTHSL